MNEYGWNIERKGLFTLQYNCLFTLNLANMVKFTLVLLNINQYRCESSLNHHLKLCPCKKKLNFDQKCAKFFLLIHYTVFNSAARNSFQNQRHGYLIRQSFREYRCKLVMALYQLRVTWKKEIQSASA